MNRVGAKNFSPLLLNDDLFLVLAEDGTHLVRDLLQGGINFDRFQDRRQQVGVAGGGFLDLGQRRCDRIGIPFPFHQQQALSSLGESVARWHGVGVHALCGCLAIFSLQRGER